MLVASGNLGVAVLQSGNDMITSVKLIIPTLVFAKLEDVVSGTKEIVGDDEDGECYDGDATGTA